MHAQYANMHAQNANAHAQHALCKRNISSCMHKMPTCHMHTQHANMRTQYTNMRYAYGTCRYAATICMREVGIVSFRVLSIHLLRTNLCHFGYSTSKKLQSTEKSVQEHDYRLACADTPDRYSSTGSKSMVEFCNHSVPLDDPSAA